MMGKLKKGEFFKSSAWDILKTILVLVAIALVAGLLLGGVNSFTQVDENEMMYKKLAEIDSSSEFVADDTFIQAADSGTILKAYTVKDKKGAIMYLASGKGYGGAVKLFVMVENNVIKSVTYYEASETPGLGDKVLKKGEIFKQFEGVDISAIEKFTISKSAPSKPGDVQAVSGSTVTSNGVGSALNAVVECHKKNIEEGKA